MHPLSPLFLLQLLSFAAALNVRRSPLTDCLNSASVPLLLTSSLQWPEAIEPFNLRFTPTPAVVAIPRTQAEVQAAVTCAYTANTRVSVKSGGHSYGAYGLSGSLVLDMVEFQKVTLNLATQVATVGAGVRLGNLASKIFALGGRGIPHGTCPGVGLGGHATLGGFGLDSRLWGLTLDTVTSMTAVLANGTVVTASEGQNRDIFWALRGAGPGFAVVTEFVMKTFAAPATNTYWSYTYEFTSSSVAAQALEKALAFGQQHVVKEVGFGVLLFPGGTLVIRGVYYGGTKTQVQILLAPMLATLKTLYGGKAPAVITKTQGWIASLVEIGGGPLTTPVKGYDLHDTFYAKSIATKESSPLSLASLKALLNYLYTTPAPSGSEWMVIANLYGGPGSVINAAPPSTHPMSTSSYAHRDVGYVFQFYAYTGNLLPPFAPQIVGFVKNMVTALGAEAASLPAYAPYADPELTQTEARERYWGGGVARLVGIKHNVDPKGILYNPQGF